MTESIFHAQIQKLMDVYQKELNQGAIEQWRRALNRFQDYEVEKGIDAVIDDPEDGHWFPKPAKVIHQINLIKKVQPKPDWWGIAEEQEFCKRCRSSGYLNVYWIGATRIPEMCWLPDEEGEPAALLSYLGLEKQPVPWPQINGRTLYRYLACCTCHHGVRRRQLTPHYMPLSYFLRWADTDEVFHGQAGGVRQEDQGNRPVVGGNISDAAVHRGAVPEVSRPRLDLSGIG